MKPQTRSVLREFLNGVDIQKIADRRGRNRIEIEAIIRTALAVRGVA